MERRRVDSAEARASANSVRGQGSARVSPEAGSRAPLSARTSDACIEGTIRTPAPFLGNNDEIFRLDDGSLWQVQFEYEYLYAYYPSVVVCPKQGFMIVEKKKLQVRPLQSSPSTSTVAPQPSEAPSATAAVIESRIDGDFEGWDGETVFRLQNGQIWQQVGAGITVHYKYSPKVLIYKSGARYKLRVDGVDREIVVERIK
ncbi:MAG: hypothetical protein K2R93_14400 [Gemmatimonadaceae bacterium]|nr:hypothetical protein [Gemmatimonadaceae bacterium]